MKIRGNTVGTPLRPGRGVVKATQLTEEEKAQARANIGAAAVGEVGGANTLIVTADENGKASHTGAQIVEHVQNGGTAIFFDGYVYVSLAHCCENSAYFATKYEDYVDTVYEVYEGNVRESSLAVASMTSVAEQIGDISSALDHIIALQETLIGNIITFTVVDDDHVYTAEKDMNWWSWVDSEYNTTGFYVDGHAVRHGSEDALGVNGVVVEPWDSPIADVVYERL